MIITLIYSIFVSCLCYRPQSSRRLVGSHSDTYVISQTSWTRRFTDSTTHIDRFGAGCSQQTAPSAHRVILSMPDICRQLRGIYSATCGRVAPTASISAAAGCGPDERVRYRTPHSYTRNASCLHHCGKKCFATFSRNSYIACLCACALVLCLSASIQRCPHLLWCSCLGSLCHCCVQCYPIASPRPLLLLHRVAVIQALQS